MRIVELSDLKSLIIIDWSKLFAAAAGRIAKGVCNAQFPACVACMLFQKS